MVSAHFLFCVWVNRVRCFVSVSLSHSVFGELSLIVPLAFAALPSVLFGLFFSWVFFTVVFSQSLSISLSLCCSTFFRFDDGFCLFFLLTRVCCLVIFVSFHCWSQLHKYLHMYELCAHTQRLKTTADEFIEFTRFLLSIKLIFFPNFSSHFNVLQFGLDLGWTCALNFFD